MQTALYTVVIISCLAHVTFSVRIPPNPCPDIFTYYKDEKGTIYGEANVPYDGNTKLDFSVNASFAGLFDKDNVQIRLINPPKETSSNKKLTYNIHFPFQNLIPKITQIKYNNKIYCSGSPEPLIPGGSGVVNVWSAYMYEFHPVSYESKPPSNAVTNTRDDDGSDDDVPFKDPHVNYVIRTTQTPIRVPPPSINNPFLNPDSRPISTIPKSSTDTRCGISGSVVALILEGTENEDGQFPWLAAMLAYNLMTSSYEYKCTATLISTKHVITAGRCVQYYQIQVVATDNILLILGTTDLKHWATNGAIERSAERVQVHPEFMKEQNSAHGDMAIITMKDPVEFSYYLRPICLWNTNDDSLDKVVDKMGTVAGWGVDENVTPGSRSNILKSKHAEIPIVSQFDCLKSNVVFVNITSDKTFCAGDKSGKGPCIGDSGAGFVIKQGDVYYLRGVASLVLSHKGTCSLKDKYAVFSDVAKHMSWVKQCMNH